jgi:glycosyltransferase involved in cell wall biosynthesis
MTLSPLPSSTAVPVLHVAEEMAPVAGGVPAVVRQLSRRLAQAGHRIGVLHARGDAQDLADCARVLAVPPAGLGRAWADSPALPVQLRTMLSELVSDAGVLHVHGVWSAPQMRALQQASVLGVSALFTAHGMLEPWLWNRQGWLVKAKKHLFWRMIAAPRLATCRVLHAITPMERDQLRALLPGNRIEVVPNAIEVPPERTNLPSGSRTKTVLFLGRIEPKKGVDLLVRAFAAASMGSDWRLEIVGPSWSPRYLQQLHDLVRQCGIEARTRFRGALFGADKEAALASAWVMATPSHSEVVGLVNLEAAVHGLPTITTHPTGLWDWPEGGGLLIEPAVDALASALRQASSWSDSEQRERGAASRRLVERRYSWAAVLPQWQALYADLASR